MDMLTQWIIAAVVVILMATGTAALIAVLLDDRDDQSDLYGDCPGSWNVELWNIDYGYRVGLRFGDRMILGRGNLAGNVVGGAPPVNDITISREHCMLYEYSGQLCVWNLSAVNPLRINGYQLNSPRFVQPGDRMQMGNSSFMVTRVDYL